MIKYILLFVPLIGLLGFALEREFISTREIFVNYGLYAKGDFKKVFDKDTISKYFSYLVVFSLYFYSSDSLRLLEGENLLIGIFRLFLSFILRNIIFYMILQNAFRKKVDFIVNVKNSTILSFKNLIYSIIVGLIWGVFERLMLNNILWIYPFVIVIAITGVMINEYSIKNL
ncbi:MAG: hypothetical protein SOU08_07645 [Anaerococcus sp.]|uniref:hypothetical protein n=1 Tax=Anaerococcus sp. AGMB09787 TaxID=2922869 RepID=UPI001FAF07FE|nr:hypothetical protein [Anaerococcus sp. AGMB09787]MDY2919491.1 hypothetical protein [Anaerococcus sp.]